ncbi:MAG: hypothetical protein Q4E47_03815 [Candidatus Saccharibacteria bacterium]|nr:hypothetical protein [Candidatus Saccharibacteria bacterium]
MKEKAFANELAEEFPQLVFKEGKRFSFRPPKTVILGPPQPYFGLLTLHELGHALSGLYNASTHVSRIKIESRAWQEAKRLCADHPEWTEKYGVEYDEDFAEANLDTYRDWLHIKSKCKKCGLTRLQDKKTQEYYCPICDLLK